MASNGLIHPSKPNEGLVPSYLSPGKGRQLLGFLTEAQGVIPAPLVVSLSPPGRGQAQSVGHRGAQEKFWTGWLTFMQAQ